MYRPQVVYHAEERARERAAAAERRMACCCSPLGRFISRVIMRCNGRARNHGRVDYAMAYAPVQTCYVRPTARNVALATSSVSDNHHPAANVQPEPLRQHAMTTTLPGAAAGKARRSKKKKRVRFTPSGPPTPADTPPPPPHQAASATDHHAAAVGGGAAGAYHHHGTAAEPPCYSPATATPTAHGYHGRWYAPSPLPRWEMLGTPRRYEYFSSEYRWYYPTPVREGIYSIATDANRLTAIFSEENPNACTIV